MTNLEFATAMSGLGFTPTLDDLRNSGQCWNSLPESLEQPDAPRHHLNKLAQLFERYGVQSRFAIHVIHRHDTVKDSETRPMKISDLNISNIHGHIFKLAPDRLLQAYEYREGPLINLADVSSAFFSELIRYLEENQLTDLLGLEVIETKQPLVEFNLGDNGTVMLKPEQAKYSKAFKETGFFYYKGEDKARQLKGNTIHAKTKVPGVYKVFVDSKLRDEAALVEALLQRGLIKDE